MAYYCTLKPIARLRFHGFLSSSRFEKHLPEDEDVKVISNEFKKAREFRFVGKILVSERNISSHQLINYNSSLSSWCSFRRFRGQFGFDLWPVAKSRRSKSIRFNCTLFAWTYHRIAGIWEIHRTIECNASFESKWKQSIFEPASAIRNAIESSSARLTHISYAKVND